MLVVADPASRPAWGTEVSVSTESEFRAAITDLSADGSAGPHIIDVAESFDFTTTGAPTYAGSQDLIITAEHGAGITIESAVADTRFLYFNPSTRANLTIENLTIEGFESSNIGGAIASFFPTTGNLTITDSTFASNASDYSGGAIYWECAGDPCELQVDRGTFGHNTSGHQAGAVYASGALATFADSNLHNNVATNAGGAVGVFASGPVVGVVYLFRSELTDNSSATGAGGAVYASDGVAGAFSEFDNNTAASDGGAIYSAGIVYSSHSTFTSNTGRHGGAVHARGEATVALSSLTSNTAERGAGLFVSESSANIVLSTFSDNEATVSTGGGVEGYMSSVRAAASTFHGNSAMSGGGAIYATFDIALERVTMSANSATQGAHVNANGFESEITAIGSVLVDAQGSDSCATPGVGGSTTSVGYNFVDDASCGFGETGDQTGAGVPAHGLLPLDEYGGPTPTRMPGTSSPLLDAIPADQCDYLPLDQRLMPRPTGDGCEIGAHEVVVAEFSDVATTHAFFFEIGWLAGMGVTGGYDDGTFRPSSNVSRQAMAAFLYRFAGEPSYTPPAIPTFPDVPASHPFFAEIEWLEDEGITGGYDDGTFRPTNGVSRQAMAAFLYRFHGETPTAGPNPTFDDVPTTSPFYDEIEWLAQTGITSGYDDGTFRPTANVTRQAMAAFLYRYEVYGWLPF